MRWDLPRAEPVCWFPVWPWAAPSCAQLQKEKDQTLRDWTCPGVLELEGWCDCCCQTESSWTWAGPAPSQSSIPTWLCLFSTKGDCSALISVSHTEVQGGWTPGSGKCTWFKLHPCDQCLGSNILHFIKLLSSGRFWKQPSWRLQIICKQDLTTWKLRFLLFFFFFFCKLR